MADAYWRYADGRTAATVTLHQQPPAAPQLPPVKRPRPDFPDVSGHPGYPPRIDQGVGQAPFRDTESLEASYEHYLRNGVPYGAPYAGVTTEPGRPMSGGLPHRPVEDRLMGVGHGDGHVGFGGSRAELPRGPEVPLPPDASNTLYVEGLPANSTRREVSHIFRPFVGFREVRLVNKGSRVLGGDPLFLAFVDFTTPAQAAIALDALQGYKFDEHEQESPCLKLQYARFPGPRSGGPRGRR